MIPVTSQVLVGPVRTAQHAAPAIRSWPAEGNLNTSTAGVSIHQGSPRYPLASWFARCFFLVTWLGFAALGRAEIAPEHVRQAIRRGVRYLQGQQNETRGGWRERPLHQGGVTALCTLALLESGEPVDSPAVARALSYLRGLDEPTSTYSAALQIMVFAAANTPQDRPLIRRNAQWLERAQIGGENGGAWSYTPHVPAGARGDNSNSQFAMLGLHEAERAGIDISTETWQRALDYWLRCQRDDGSWGYYLERGSESPPPGTGSMTCAGIAAVVIAAGQLHEGDARVVGDAIRCCQPQADDSPVQRGLQWLGRHFSVQHNPGPIHPARLTQSQAGLFYYLYGVERVGRLTGQRFIGQHDWYREGAAMLVAEQDALSGFWVGRGHAEDDPLIATSLALLFLSKGRRPVVMAKLQYGEADTVWDPHRNGVHHLSLHLEDLWQQQLTWQTIDLRAASLEDLMESPVLLISGTADLPLTAEQKDNVRNYVRQGGFLFAEACGDGDEFDRAFRSLVRELFPDQRMQLLPPEHPIWFAQQEVDPEFMRPLYGIDACCRTSVVYSPEDLSCLWELSRGERTAEYPPKVQAEIDAGLAIGANVLAYATNRQLREKLEPPRIIRPGEAAQQLARGRLVIPQLQHGGSDPTDAANALPNLTQWLESEVGLRVGAMSEPIALTDLRLFDYPLLFTHGRRDFRWDSAQRNGLATYLRRGGFVFANAICASSEFANAFRREVQAALPEAEFLRIPYEHPLFTRQFGGKDLDNVRLRDPQSRQPGDPLEDRMTRIRPLLEAVEIDGRLVAVFSPYDISCALEQHAALGCKGYPTEDAAALSINVILYALQQ